MCINYLKCIKICLKQNSRVLVIRVSGRFHKGRLNPLPCRPAAQVVGSTLCSIGRWVGINLRELLLCYKTHIKNLDDVLKRLKKFKRFFITAYDTESMCPSIRTEEGLEFLTLDLDSF